MQTILSKAMAGTGGRPPAAVEIAPEGVVAAAVGAPGQGLVYATAPLPAGSVAAGVAESNVKRPEALAAAIRTALDEAGARGRWVTVVLPDTSVRVFVLDFDSFPLKAVEALPVLRFRLRKMVPFAVDDAGLSYQILTENKSEVKVLAAVLPGAVLAEYEAAVRAAGYEPGAVLPSSLAMLEAVGNEEAALIANLTPVSLTTSIVSGTDLLLYRTLDLPADAESRIDEVQRGIAVAAAFFEDKLGQRPGKIHYAGMSGAEAFARWIEAPEQSIADLVPRPETGAATALGNASLAAVTGALEGVR